MEPKKKLKESNPKTITFTIPEYLLEQLDEHCEKEGYTRTAWLCAMIENSIDEVGNV